jgi:hypothetical protein
MSATPATMLQIVGYGLQDRERLNLMYGQPSTRYYSYVYRRRTRWASQWRRVEFDNLADFGKRATVTVPILGELITRATLVVDLPDIFAIQNDVGLANPGVTPQWSWTNALGHAICSNVDFQISGQVIDQLDSRLLEVLNEQTGTVEHFDSTNNLIARNPSNYTDEAWKGYYPTQVKNQTLEIVFPFWWNRGPGPQALPIQALAKEKVQINVNFRTVQECVYTSTLAASNPALTPAGGVGPLPTFAGCPFLDATGTPIPGKQMPTDWHFKDAYWIIEYVSLEDREASAFRQADLTIPIEQHIAVPMVTTGGARQVRIPLGQAGLVRDMTWVAQREEAVGYNAYFLFSRDIRPAAGQPVWWPDTQLPNWDYGDGFIRPGFSDRRSDPIAAATMWIRGMRRFEHEGPSLFRSLIPALNCGRAPLIDRYIYRYDFGFWPTGGLAEALYRPRDEVRGFANWDKLPSRELMLTMNQDDCNQRRWEADETAARTYPAGVLVPVEGDFSPATEAFRIELVGASVAGRAGAYVRGVLDYQAVRRLVGFQNLLVRTNTGGSASLVALGSTTNTWIAVAASCGRGAAGGAAGSAVAIGERGVDGVVTHAATADAAGGGAGGGRLTAAGVGAPDGIQMPTTTPFVLSHQKTGGTTLGVAGGDGYYGGGSGTAAGGGGGSYVSRYISEVDSGRVTALPLEGDAYVRLTPLRAVYNRPPSFNIYIWLTTYNLLRITAGRAGLMFAV